MLRPIFGLGLLFTLVSGAPAPQVPGYTDADGPFAETPEPITPLATSFYPDSQVPVRI